MSVAERPHQQINNKARLPLQAWIPLEMLALLW